MSMRLRTILGALAFPALVACNGGGAGDTGVPLDASDVATVQDTGSSTDVAFDIPGPSPNVCLPQNAASTGSCATVLGLAWNGTSCITLTGCSCLGTDCATLYPSQTACDAAHASCVSGSDCRTTGCSSGQSCMECRTEMGGGYVCIPSGSAC